MKTDPRSDALATLISVVRPKLMAEFGSWEGASAVTFLESARQSNLELTMVCVDTWLGSKEHWENSQPDSVWSFEHLRVIDGEPRVIETFRNTISSKKFSSQVKIVRAPTSYAAGYIRSTFPALDLVYVDADHSFRGVSRDLKLALKLLRLRGVIAGDDWGWLSVRLAAAAFALNRFLIFRSPDKSTYALVRSNDHHLKEQFGTASWRKELPLLVLTVGWICPAIKMSKRFLRESRDSLYLSLRISQRNS